MEIKINNPKQKEIYKHETPAAIKYQNLTIG